MDLNPTNLKGCVHEFTFDLETQGIRTSSYTGGRFRGRGPNEPIGISSIAYGRSGKAAHINSYTDLITPELLRKHAVTGEMLDKGALPDSLLDEVTRNPHIRYNPNAPPRWDPSLRSRGSVVDQVFRRHAKHVLKGEGVLAQHDVYQQLVQEWSGIASAGGKISLGAWNVGYDMPTLLREIRRHGYGTEIDNLMKSNSMQVREMAENLHSMRFESMLRSNWTPVMTDRAAAQAAVDQGIRAITPESARSLGAIVEHKGLREFMDDVKGGRESFKARASKWVQSKRAGSAHAQAVAEDVINRLSSVHDWASFQEFVEYGHRNAHSVIFGEQTLHGVLGEMYGTGTHAHILGDVKTLHSTMKYAPMAGKFSAFSFIGGGKLSDVSGALVGHAKELGVSEETASHISSLMGDAHTADADRTLMERTSVELDRIRRDNALFERWMRIDQKTHRESAERRAGELFQDVLHGDSPIRSAADSLSNVLHGGGEAMKRIYKKMGNTSMFLWAGLGMAASYMIGKHNEIEKPPTIQGFRQPEGNYDTIRGIDASKLPFANISAFGSGYDQFYGEQQKPQRVRITKVIDGDTVQFARDGRIVTGRLAGVDTPETVNPHKPVQKGGPEASQFLKNLLHGQEVWVRPAISWQGGEDDKYGREMIWLDMGGMSVNSEIVRQGHSKALAAMPDPYFQGSEAVGYLKHRMQVGIDATFDQITSIFASDQRAPDPFMWSALGTVGTMTSEDDTEDEAPREQPVGYGGLQAQRFRNEGFAGYVQQLSEDTIGHTIRDHATQLHRLPGMPRTLRGRHSYGMVSHAERAAMMGD